MSEILCSCGSNLEEFSLLECDTVWFSRNNCTNVLEECFPSIFKAEVKPLPCDMLSLYKRQFLKECFRGFISLCQYWQLSRATGTSTYYFNFIFLIFVSFHGQSVTGFHPVTIIQPVLHTRSFIY